MSRKVIITKGLPASGKSSWAEIYVKANPNTKRINKDLLREMLDFSAHSSGKEKQVINARNMLIQSMLAAGFSVIVDDTNLNPIHEEEIRKLTQRFNTEHQANVFVEIKDFTDVPVEECIKRDVARAKSIGPKAIRTMYNEWLRPDPPKVDYDPALPGAVICDLDGTLALLNGRDPYDASTCEQDELCLPVYETLLRFEEWLPDTGSGLQDRFIILVSGRMDIYHAQTEAWLKKHKVPYDALYMRPQGDMRKDVIIKQEIYEREIKGKYNVLFVLDDRQQVVDGWRSLGLTVFQVSEGDF